MAIAVNGSKARLWMREMLAGWAGALAALPVVLTLGLLVFSPLGAQAPQLGLFAAFLTVGIGGLVHTLVSRTSMPASGPSVATALTLTTFVTQLLADPALAATGAAAVQGVIGLCSLTVLLSGALQVGMALLGWARLARAVPQPVLAGFMNGAALLIVLAQLPPLLGLPLGSPLSRISPDAVQPAALVLGLGTAGATWLAARRWPRLPASLLALALGSAVHGLISTWPGAPAAGATVGPLPLVAAWQPALAWLFGTAGWALLQAHAGLVVLTALALAAIGALESSFNVRAIDQLLKTRHEPGRELLAIGCSNVLCGLLGGLPLVVARTRALATLQAGGTGRLALLTGPVAFCLLYTLGGPLLALLPLPVLAGLMLIVAVALADQWSSGLLLRWWAGDHSRDLALGLGVMALVVGTTLWKGMAAGIGLGVLLSLLSFAVRMNRPLVHDRYSAAARPSRRIYPAPVEARLGALRKGIEVFELEGALFFGSAENLLDEADTLDAGCRCLVVDLRRVSAIDESGAMALQNLVTRAGRRGIQVELAGLVQAWAPARALHSFAPGLPHWPDADRAIEAAERRLLGDGEVHGMAEVPLDESALLAGLDAAQRAAVTRQLQPRHLLAGELLFAEGDPGDRLYVLSKGSVSVLSTPDRHGRSQRYLSVSPGMMIGETAMLDGGGRTAGAVADTPTDVHALTLDALDELGRSHPQLAIRLYRNVALHLSQRLREAAGAWRASAR